MNTLDWLQTDIPTPSTEHRAAAIKRQGILTKPPGALGELETIAIELAAMQATAHPAAESVYISIFAGDHGIAAEGVSAFPQAVTAEMVKNFARGGAAICVAAQHCGAHLSVVNLGTVFETGALDGVETHKLGPGTQNFLHQAAMNEEQLTAACALGAAQVDRAQAQHVDIFIGGEMGIANTTSATALACALLKRDASSISGPGTGLDQDGVQAKATIINKALQQHKQDAQSPLEIVRYFGGFEIAALCGAYIRCAQLRIPMLIDGFISSVAALCAQHISPGVKAWMLFGHQSAEPGHQYVLQALQAKPLLNIGMRLGEGSGAAVAVPLLRLACDLHNKMATFAEADVSEQL